MGTTLKTTLLLLAFMSAITSFAQTKAETEKWILEKLNLYMVKKTSYQKFEISYSNGYFQFKTETHSGNFDFKHTTTIYRFPVWAIEKVAIYPTINDLHTLYFSIQKYCEECKEIRINHYSGGSDKRSEKDKMSFVGVDFKTNDPEENFLERFNKAIEHLKTFYPAPAKKKETF